MLRWTGGSRTRVKAGEEGRGVVPNQLQRIVQRPPLHTSSSECRSAVVSRRSLHNATTSMSCGASKRARCSSPPPTSSLFGFLRGARSAAKAVDETREGEAAHFDIRHHNDDTRHEESVFFNTAEGVEGGNDQSHDLMALQWAVKQPPWRSRPHAASPTTLRRRRSNQQPLVGGAPASMVVSGGDAVVQSSPSQKARGHHYRVDDDSGMRSITRPSGAELVTTFVDDTGHPYSHVGEGGRGQNQLRCYEERHHSRPVDPATVTTNNHLTSTFPYAHHLLPPVANAQHDVYDNYGYTIMHDGGAMEYQPQQHYYYYPDAAYEGQPLPTSDWSDWQLRGAHHAAIPLLPSFLPLQQYDDNFAVYPQRINGRTTKALGNVQGRRYDNGGDFVIEPGAEAKGFSELAYDWPEQRLADNGTAAWLFPPSSHATASISTPPFTSYARPRHNISGPSFVEEVFQ